MALQRADVVVVSRHELPGGLLHRGERWLSAQALFGSQGDRLLSEASAAIYLASSSNPGTFAVEPWREVPANVEPASRFFQRCTTANPAIRIVVTSSGGTVYGRVPLGRPVDETHAAAPISGYGLGKLMIEEALRCYSRLTGAPFAILRIANAVGTYQRSHTQGIITAALRALRDGTPINVFGAGDTVRDYVHADDVAAAIYAAAADTRFTDRTWNVGSGIGRSIIDVLSLVGRVTGRPVPIRHGPPRCVDVPYIVLDCRRIRADLGWVPERDLADAIAETWQAVLAEPTPVALERATL